MALLQKIIDKIRGNESEEEGEELPDDVTRDKYLRSLRREDRVLDEAEEKQYLLRKIAARRKLKEREYLWGVKEKIRKKKEENYSFLEKHEL